MACQPGVEPSWMKLAPPMSPPWWRVRTSDVKCHKAFMNKVLHELLLHIGCPFLDVCCICDESRNTHRGLFFGHKALTSRSLRSEKRDKLMVRAATAQLEQCYRLHTCVRACVRVTQGWRAGPFSVCDGYSRDNDTQLHVYKHTRTHTQNASAFQRLSSRR